MLAPELSVNDDVGEIFQVTVQLVNPVHVADESISVVIGETSNVHLVSAFMLITHAFH